MMKICPIRYSTRASADSGGAARGTTKAATPASRGDDIILDTLRERPRSTSLSRQLEEALAQLPRDRPRLAVADHAAVALRHGDHFRGGAGQEALVGGVHVMAR